MAFTATPGTAQIPDVDVEVRGGIALPAGDLNEVGRMGGVFGVGVSHALTGRLAVRVDGDFELLGQRAVGETLLLPSTTLWHYHAGLELDVVPMSEASQWRVAVRGGAGGTTYDTERFAPDEDDFIDTYVSVSGGISAGRTLRPGLELGVVAQSYVVFTDKDRTGEIADRSELLNRFSKASSFPVGIYLRWER